MTTCYGKVGNCTSSSEFIWVGPYGGEYYLCTDCSKEWRGEMEGAGTALSTWRINRLPRRSPLF
jgi:hypothetical protein